MSQFLETVAVKNGLILNKDYHIARIAKTQIDFYGFECAQEIINQVTIDCLWPCELSKCSVLYDTQLLHTKIQLYQPLVHTQFKIMHLNDLNYAYKFSDRETFKKLKENVADELIVCKNNWFTDCTYANLVFEKKGEWYTPENPLLNGTARQRLLQNKQIGTAQIGPNNLHNYSRFKLINALLDLENSRSYSIDCIVM